MWSFARWACGKGNLSKESPLLKSDEETNIGTIQIAYPRASQTQDNETDCTITRDSEVKVVLLSMGTSGTEDMIINQSSAKRALASVLDPPPHNVNLPISPHRHSPPHPPLRPTHSLATTRTHLKEFELSHHSAHIPLYSLPRSLERTSLPLLAKQISSSMRPPPRPTSQRYANLLTLPPPTNFIRVRKLT